MMKSKYQSAHVIGVCGSGMSSLAHIMLDRGLKVSGSDLRKNHNADELQSRGLIFYEGHKVDNIREAEVVVASGAVPLDNPELREAISSGKVVRRRAEFLAEFLSEKKIILVCGSHGKSSTTAMLAKILKDCGYNPSYYVGGNVADLERPGAWGEGEWAVVEGDESDGSAVAFSPTITVLLNAEWEHVDHFKSPAEIENFFINIAKNSSQCAVCCGDDLSRDIILKIGDKAVTFGSQDGCALKFNVINPKQSNPEFALTLSSGEKVISRLSISGLHQISNATGSVLAALEAGCDFLKAVASVEKFSGVDRRMQKIGGSGDVIIISDYAHHPTEVKVTLNTVRSGAIGRVIAVFQPHRYSRSQTFANSYGTALAAADIVFLTDIYSAGEEQPMNFSGEIFSDSVRHSGAMDVRYCQSRNLLWRSVIKELQKNDTLIVMGAGDIHRFALEIAKHKETETELLGVIGGDGSLQTMCDLSKKTTIKIGGPAEFYVEPRNVDTAARVLKYIQQKELPLTILGRGSNLLIRDGGIRGVVMHLPREKFSQMRIEDNKIIAGAGVRLKELVYFAKQHGLGGLEFLEGIPGSLGGSLRMNAGAMGAWIFDSVIDVSFLDRDGNFYKLPRQAFDAKYRSVPQLVGKLVVEATLKAVPTDVETINGRLKEYSRKRWDSQPNLPSAGCFFKNPEWGSAGKLIDITKLKGISEGGASVSTVHGNFLVNNRNATASDMLRLMDKIKNTIRREHGIELENEVIILGEDA